MKEVEIEFSPRVWRGTPTSIRQAWTSAMGLRLYEVNFKGKRMYYEISSKQTLPIHVGMEIRFVGHWSGEGSKKYFYITEVLDSAYINQLEAAEQERIVKILMEESYEQRDI
jgi:hypothetical protein